MTREQIALLKMKRANQQIVLAMGALTLASLNARKAMRYLAEVRRRGIVPEATQSAEDNKKALEDMVEVYSSSVN